MRGRERNPRGKRRDCIYRREEENDGLGEEREVLEMILLKSLFDVVDLIGRKQSAHSENAGGQHLSGQTVEHALSVHEKNTETAFWNGR